MNYPEVKAVVSYNLDENKNFVLGIPLHVFRNMNIIRGFLLNQHIDDMFVP